MTTLQDYKAAGVPARQLGRSFRDWNQQDISTILRHFGVDHQNKRGGRGQNKLEMLRKLDRVTREHTLTEVEARSILSGRGLDRPISSGNLTPVPPYPPQVTGQCTRLHPHRHHRNRVPNRLLAEARAAGNRSSRRLQPIEAGGIDQLSPREASQGDITPFSHGNRDITIPGSITSTSNSNTFNGTRKTSNQRECTVCMESLPLLNFPARKTTSSCNHEPEICAACLSQSIATQFSSKAWNNIDCPTCDQRLDYAGIKEFADDATFEKYDNLSLEACLSETQGARFQRCRMPECKSGHYCFPEVDNYMICRDCGGRTCITCDIQWHPGVSCAEIKARRAQQQKEEETAAEEYLTTNSKLCPKCNIRGEKVKGCDHMTCPRCRHEYCWACLADFQYIRRQGNHMHRITCRYHTDNLPRTLGDEGLIAATRTAAPTDSNTPRRTEYIHAATVERRRVRHLQHSRTHRHPSREEVPHVEY